MCEVLLRPFSHLLQRHSMRGPLNSLDSDIVLTYFPHSVLVCVIISHSKGSLCYLHEIMTAGEYVK